MSRGGDPPRDRINGSSLDRSKPLFPIEGEAPRRFLFPRDLFVYVIYSLSRRAEGEERTNRVVSSTRDQGYVLFEKKKKKRVRRGNLFRAIQF